MRVLSVDLAATFSAAMVMNEHREVLTQFDSSGTPPLVFWKNIRKTADVFEVDFLAVEDISPQMQFQIDRTYRMQGLGMAVCHTYLERWVMIQPQAWQKHWPGTGTIPIAISRGMTKGQKDAYRTEQMRLAALSLGYEPPNLVAQYEADFRLANGETARILKKNTDPLVKSMTDYVAAYLIADFAVKRGLATLLQTPSCSPPNI